MGWEMLQTSIKAVKQQFYANFHYHLFFALPLPYDRPNLAFSNVGIFLHLFYRLISIKDVSSRVQTELDKFCLQLSV